MQERRPLEGAFPAFLSISGGLVPDGVIKLFHPLAVGAVCGVDGDYFTGLDEEGNHNLGAGLEGNFLEGGSGSGIAFDGGLAVGDFQSYVSGKLAGEAALFGLCHEHHLHVLAFLHEVGIVHHVVGTGNLLVGFFVHEVECFAIVIEELIGTTLNGDGVQLDAGGESVLQDAAVLQIAELGLYESGALTGFNVLEVHYDAGFAVEHNVHSVLQISSCCHKIGMFS